MQMFDNIAKLFNRPLKRVGPWKPRTAVVHDASPYDLDAGERITRFTGTVDKWPYPPIIGSIQPFMPMATRMIFLQATALPIGGPNVTLGNTFNVQNQVAVPNLGKTAK